MLALVAQVAAALVARLVVLPSAMEPAAAHDAMELGAASLAIDANSNSLVAPVIQSRLSAMELLAAMELPSAMETAAVHNANFGVGSGSHSYQHYIL